MEQGYNKHRSAPYKPSSPSVSLYWLVANT